MDQDLQNQQPSPDGAEPAIREEETSTAPEPTDATPAAEEPGTHKPDANDPSVTEEATTDEPVIGDDILEEPLAEAEESADGESVEIPPPSTESTPTDGEQPSEGMGETPPETGLTQEQIVEAILFSSDNPLPASKVATVVGALSSREIRAIVERLNANYAQWNAAFRVQEIAGGYQMVTRSEFATYLQQLHKVRSESKLSPASLETLAIVAYKQPVLRAEIEAIRGVACGETLRTLMEKDLVKIVGRAEELGRPMLYGTTKKFMQVFGLASLEDLPKVPELLPPRAPAAPPAEKNPDTPPAAQANVDEIKASQEQAPAPPTAPAGPESVADTEE